MSVLEIVLLVLVLNLVLLSAYLAHQLQVRKAQLRLVRESRWQTAQVLHSAQARLAQVQDSALQVDHNATLHNHPK
jgi:hypothetical protein